MTLHVFDSDLVYRGRIVSYRSLEWCEEYCGKGSFTLTVTDTDENAKILTLGCYLYRNDRPTAMVCVSIERSGDDGTIKLGGYTTLELLDRRVVKGTFDCSTYSTAEAAAIGCISTNLRSLPVTISGAKGYSGTSEQVFENAGMLETLESIAEEVDLGLRMNFDAENRTHTFELYQGTDHSYSEDSGGIVFSSEFNNLITLTIEEDEDCYKNYAYCYGEDDDGNVVYGEYGDSTATGMNRREVITQGDSQTDEQTDAQYAAYLQTQAQTSLQDYYRAQTFTVTIDESRFGTSFDLGDKVTCKSSRYGLQFNTRITQYKYTDDNGSEAVSLTLGDPVITFLRGSILKHG